MAVSALDKLITVENLKRVWKNNWQKARKTTFGVDGVTPQDFNDQLATRIKNLREQVKSGYVYSPLRAIKIPKTDTIKFRIICVPTVQDRLIQKSLLEAIESKSVALGINNEVSFGFVRDDQKIKRGVFGAVNMAAKYRSEKPWVVKADIESFFDSINRKMLLDNVHGSFRLKSLSKLIELAIGCEVDERDPSVKKVLKENGIERGKGLRQGMPISPILSNLVLKNFDAKVIQKRYPMVRYADDLVLFSSFEEECREMREFLDAQLSVLGHRVSTEKTHIISPGQPVEFLGMELGLRSDCKNYELRVSEAQIASIKENFSKFHNIDFCIKEKLDILKFLRKVENMKSGYRTAYAVAGNFDRISDSLEQWSKKSIQSLYKSIFKVDI